MASAIVYADILFLSISSYKPSSFSINFASSLFQALQCSPRFTPRILHDHEILLAGVHISRLTLAV